MTRFKVYVAQKPDGEIVAIKLTHLAAHQYAKLHAPCSVDLWLPDKLGPDMTITVEEAENGTQRNDGHADRALRIDK